MTTAHRSITGADLHVPGYVQSGDPGAVGAGKLWFNTGTDTLYTRNAANTGWVAAHPDLAAHDAMGLATDAELTAHDAKVGTAVGNVHISRIANDARAAADAPSLYPTGMSLMFALSGTAGGWPSNTGTLRTTKASTDTYAVQQWHPVGVATPQWRAWTGAAWSAWTAFEPTGTVATHAAAADPHAGYLLESVVSALATPAIVLGSAAAAGSGTTPIRHNATIAAFDTTAPSTQAFADAAAVGTAAFAARRDHKHAMPTDPVTAHAALGAPAAHTPDWGEAGDIQPLGTAAAAGATAEFADAGHVHKLMGGAAVRTYSGLHTIAANASEVETITWPTPFADANYKAVAMVWANATGIGLGTSLWWAGVEGTQTANGFDIRISNDSAETQVQITAIGIHD